MQHAGSTVSRPEGVGIEHLYSHNCLSSEFWEHCSAFANSEGGRIDIRSCGSFDSDVDELIGILLSESSDRSNISSNLIIYSDITRTEEGFSISVPSADKGLRPVFVRGHPLTGTFVRHGGRTVRCSVDQVNSMLRDSSDPYDGKIIPYSDISVINTNSLEWFRKSLAEEHIWKRLDDCKLMSASQVVKDAGDGPLPTEAGILLFSDHHAASSIFRGYGLRYSDDEISFDSEDGRWSGNIIDFCSAVSLRFIESFPQIQDPLRELMINALAHSDFNFGQGVAIECRNNSVKISNSGLFRTDIQESVQGRRDRRNPVMARILKTISSKIGLEGAISKFNDKGYDTYIDMDRVSGTVTVTVRPISESGIGISLNAQGILDIISADNDLTISEISDIVGLSKRQTERYIAELKSEGLIIREGSRRAGRWKTT